MNKEWQIVIEFFGFKSKYSQPEVDGSKYISLLLKHWANIQQKIPKFISQIHHNF